MNTKHTLSTQIRNKKGGFTLIEVISVLVLLGILAAIAVPKYIDLAASARDRAVDAGISELNGREALTWGNIVISNAGWEDDATTFAAIDTALGADYSWEGSPPTAAGGTLQFQDGTAVALTRTASTAISPGNWSR